MPERIYADIKQAKLFSRRRCRGRSREQCHLIELGVIQPYNVPHDKGTGWLWRWLFRPIPGHYFDLGWQLRCRNTSLPRSFEVGFDTLLLLYPFFELLSIKFKSSVVTSSTNLPPPDNTYVRRKQYNAPLFISNPFIHIPYGWKLLVFAGSTPNCYPHLHWLDSSCGFSFTLVFLPCG